MHAGNLAYIILATCLMFSCLISDYTGMIRHKHRVYIPGYIYVFYSEKWRLYCPPSTLDPLLFDMILYECM